MNVRRRWTIPFMAVVCMSAAAIPARAAQLVVLERQGCVWCDQFENEIASIYPKTDEASIAPLRRVDIDAPWPEDLPHMAHDRFTPTFVLVADGKVMGRIRGYPGENFFWPAIDELLSSLPDR